MVGVDAFLSQTNYLGGCVHGNELVLILVASYEGAGGKEPKESKDCPQKCWRCSQFCGETGSGLELNLAALFFSFNSRLPR